MRHKKAELRELVVKGPDPEKDNVVRWRCVDLQEEIASRFSVRVHEGTVGKRLRQFRLTQLQPEPCHPKTDLAAQEALEKRARVAGPPVA
jgi:putative transposase